MRRTSHSGSWWGGATAFAVGAAAAGLVVRGITHRRRRMDFRGKVVLITGGSRGFGLLLARRFVREGAKVAVCSRNPTELNRAEAELRSHGVIEPFIADVTHPDDCEYMIREVTTRLGPVDVLVNNAGVIQVGPVETMTRGDFDESMRTHFQGPLELILRVLPGMRQRKQGRIVNVTSIGGKVPAPHLVPYCAGKFALVGLSESLRTELTKDDVYVTTVVPGLMRTGSPRNALFKGRHREEYAWFATADVMPLLSVDPDRLAAAVVDACRYGQASIVRPLAAYLQVLGHGIAPGLTMELASLFNRALPGPGGIGTQRKRGAESDSPFQPTPARAANESAARQNNEFATD